MQKSKTIWKKCTCFLIVAILMFSGIANVFAQHNDAVNDVEFSFVESFDQTVEYDYQSLELLERSVPNLTLSTNTLNFPGVNSSTRIGVTSNGTWTVSSNVSWLNFYINGFVPPNRTGSGSFEVRAFQNLGTSSRTGTITVSVPGATPRTITVTQGVQVPSLLLSASAWTPSSTANSVTIDVASNRTWTATSNVTWLTVTPASRTGDGSFSINTTENFGGLRTGTITVTAPGASTRTITVRQHASQQRTVTINLNANSGSVNPAQITGVSGLPIGVLPRPTRAGNYRFVNWFNTSASVGGTRFVSTSIIPNNNMNMTLFARWSDPTRHMTHWWHSNTIPLGPTTIATGLGPFWQASMNRGISNWNDSDAPVTFDTASGNSSVIVKPLPPSVGLLGWLTSTTDGRGTLTGFNIVLNSTAITAHVAVNPNFNIGNVIESVMAHELGHAVGLRDNPDAVSGGDGSLMNHARNRNSVRVPLDFDIESVRMLFD